MSRTPYLNIPLTSSSDNQKYFSDWRAGIDGTVDSAMLKIDEVIGEHINKNILSEDGTHGIRINNGTIQVLNDNAEWVDVIYDSDEGTAPAIHAYEHEAGGADPLSSIVEHNAKSKQKFWRGTQEEYDRLEIKSSDTMYIVDGPDDIVAVTANNVSYDNLNSGIDADNIQDAIDSLIEHTHDEYALADHEHTEYALSNHAHDEYANTEHSHKEYAPVTHDHDADYAKLEHNHLEYSPITHTHTPSDVGADEFGAAAAVRAILEEHKNSLNPHSITPEMIGALAIQAGMAGQVLGFTSDNVVGAIDIESGNDCSVVFGTYVGDGVSVPNIRYVTLGFKPRFVWVGKVTTYRSDPSAPWDVWRFVNTSNNGLMWASHINSDYIFEGQVRQHPYGEYSTDPSYLNSYDKATIGTTFAITDNGFSVADSDFYAAYGTTQLGVYSDLNNSGNTYFYLAIK